MYGFQICYDEGKHNNIYDVSGSNIRIVGYTIIYLHCGNLRKPLMINIAENLGRDGEVILSLRTLRRMGAIPEQWPVIDKMKFAEWNDNIYSEFDTKFKDEVNKVAAEGESAHDIACEEVRQRIIKRHPKVFANELNGNAMKMDPVSVKFKPDAVKPKVAYTAREPPVHWQPAAK